MNSEGFYVRESFTVNQSGYLAWRRGGLAAAEGSSTSETEGGRAADILLKWPIIINKHEGGLRKALARGYAGK